MKVFGGLGIQSYCFRNFKDNAKLAELLKDCGVGAVELCGVHVNFGDTSSFDKAIATFKDAGIKIVSIGVEGVGAKSEELEKRFVFAKQAGAKFISVHFSLAEAPECYRTGERLADKYDLKLAIHNHGGKHWLGSGEMLQHVLNSTSERVGICLDTAWAMDSHEDPVKLVERFGKRLYGLHLKDFVFNRAGGHEDVVVGTGNLNLKALAAALEGVSFSGYSVIEYEGDVENPVPALKSCVSGIRAAFPSNCGL